MAKSPRRYIRSKIPKGDRLYRSIWRVVDGAVYDAFKHHPEYLTDLGKRTARQSVVKRVTGAIKSFAEQSAKGRSGSSPAAE